MENNSQRSGDRSRSFGINDSVGEVSLFDRDEETEINISQSLGLNATKKPPLLSYSMRKKTTVPNLDDTLGMTRDDLLEASMVQASVAADDDLMYSSAGTT